jgi:PAS domain S-box-containing protein
MDDVERRTHMSIRNESRSLLATFDSLAKAHTRPWIGAPRVPFLVIGLIVLLIAGLFVALVVEERHVKREAMSRDIDAAARQLGLRLDGLGEALSAVAFDLNDARDEEQRFREQATELLASRRELSRLQYVDPNGQVLVQADAIPNAGAVVPLENALATRLDQLGAAGTLIFVHLGDDPSQITAVVPVMRQQRYHGAIVARIDGGDLLMRGIAPEIIERYRLALTVDDQVMATTAASFADGVPAHYATTISPLPANMHLKAAGYATDAPLAESAPIWGFAGLALTVVVALASLAAYMARQGRIDSALLAEASLRRAMEDSLATGLRVLDMSGAIRYVNRAFCRMSGWTAQELVGRAPPFPDWAPEDVAANMASFEAMLAGGDPPAGTEIVVQRPDGSRFDARMYSSRLVDATGQQIGWMTSIADVTEQRRIRRELSAAHERFKTVLESIDAAVSVTASTTGDLLFANRSYSERFGSISAGHARLAKTLNQREGGEIFDPPTGCWFDVRSRTIQWPVDRAGATTLEPNNDARLQIASDITLRKTTEETARQQQEKVQFTARLMTMGEMASSLAHELNQPLTAIGNYSEGTLARLRGGALPPEDLRGALAKMAQQAQRAGAIIRRIREFVKRSEPRRRPTPAARIVEDAIAFAEIEANKKAIAIVAEVDPHLPPLDVDPILIEQVLLNLLKNALDSMNKPVVPRIDIRVRAGTTDGQAEISVIDRGGGIAPGHLSNLFQPFFSTKAEGMGMGLNICRSIVEFHHGRIYVEANPEPVGGSIVRITLPVARSTVQTEAALTRT